MRPLPQDLTKVGTDRDQTSPVRTELTPLEKLPLYQSDIEWALRFGRAGPTVKELREISKMRKTQDTLELANREQELNQFLWREYPTVAEQLGLPRLKGLAKPTTSTPEEKELADALLEVAIPAIEHQKQTKNERPTLPSVLRPILGRINPNADLWNDFYTEFSNLAKEEGHNTRTQDDYLTASCTYKRGAVVWHERGKPEQGLHSLLKMPECGIWRVSSGVSENFQERFRTLATRAGLSLGCPEGSDPEDFWLHSLFQDLLENGSKYLFAAKRDEGGMIRNVCEASAAFCARLERKAVQKQGVRSHQNSGSTARKLAIPQKNKADQNGLRRARLVSKLIIELNTLRALMQVPDDDFPNLSKQNPNYQVFKICKKHPSASKWVKLLPDRRSINSLAYEIAAIEFGRSAATIQTAWKRYKKKIDKRAR
jgi:hypothetical protein